MNSSRGHINLKKLVAFTICFFLSTPVLLAATITGKVTGPDDAPFRAAFVQARNSKTKMTVTVLSGIDGLYSVENLPAGDYQIHAKSIGYQSNSKSGIQLTADQTVAMDWRLQKQTVRWDEIPIMQGIDLFPDGPGKSKFARCGSGCHGFQQVLGVRRDQEGWREVLKDHRTQRIGGAIILDTIHNDADIDELSAYAGKYFGPGPKALPDSPAELPAYEASTQKFTDDALKIVYVTYEMPPGRMTWDANPDKDGNIWCPYFGTVNGVGRLNPDTGDLKEYLWETPLKRVGTRSAHLSWDGISAWVAEEGGTLVRVNVKTGKQTRFKSPGNRMNTVREDPNGFLWLSGGPFSLRFDPKTETFTEIKGAPETYGVNADKFGNLWFDEYHGQGRIFQVDYKTSKVTEYTPPPQPGSRRRVDVDSAGNAWLTQFERGQIVRLDAKTGDFKEFSLPGEKPSPYPVAIDANDQIWYASGFMDTVDRLDPATGKVTEYPPPGVGGGLRELSNDPKGRMWFASPGNNTVGYFYLAK